MSLALAGAEPTPDTELLHELQAVMETIEAALEQLPAGRGHLVVNALLNLAVAHVRREEGDARAAALLRRLAVLVASGVVPEGEAAVPLRLPDA